MEDARYCMQRMVKRCGIVRREVVLLTERYVKERNEKVSSGVS